MARTLFGHTNGVTNGEGPPPSTLAAQIVKNQARTAPSRQNEQQALFGSLLHEILHDSAAEVESDVATNVQLIKVLAEAGVIVLTQDAPFASDIRSQQARDSIAVIERTIKRQPDTLVTPVTEGGPPLCLWLVIQVIPVLSRHETRTLPVIRLIDAVIYAVGRSVKHWQVAARLTSAVQDCVNDVLTALETTTAGELFTLRLPPARSTNILWPHPSDSIAASFESSVCIRDAVNACELAARLSELASLTDMFRSESCTRLIDSLTRRKHVFRDVNRWTSLVCHLVEVSSIDNQHALIEALLRGTRPGSHYLPDHLQQGIATSLTCQLGSHNFRSSLLTTLTQVRSSAGFDGFEQSLKTAILALLNQDDRVAYTSASGSHVHKSHIAGCASHSRLRVHTAKRRKLGPESNSSTTSKLFTNGDSEISLADRLAKTYLALKSSDQHEAWQYLSNMARDKPADVGSAISLILDNLTTSGDAISRTLCMQTMQQCIQHATDHKLLDLSASSMGSVCLRSLQSSSRDLRIAAGNCITAFLRTDISSNLREQNCKTALQWMRQLSDQDILGVQETLITAWGNIAQVSIEQELNLVLLQLVDYLGHRNSLIRGLAFSEIKGIADRKPTLTTVESILSPFWSSIATSVVQDLISRPQKCHMLCELIGKNVSEFLIDTQVHFLPFLVATKKRDILQRVTNACGSDATIFDMLLQPRENLVAVLSHLLCQTGLDSEEHVMSCLTAVDQHFTEQDLGDLVKLDSTAIACDILRLAGRQNENHKTKVHGAFTVLADLCERSAAQRRSHPRSSRSLNAFLERQVLGILTKFSTIIESNKIPDNDLDKFECINATAELIALAKDKISLALPQVKALLQSAIEQEALCELAWSAWLKLLPVLTTDDIGTIIEQSFALLLRHWHSFSSELQQRTHETIAQIVPRHRSAITMQVNSLPSLSHLPLFSKIGSEIDHLQNGETIDNRLKSFSARLRGSNNTIVRQALMDLAAYLNTNQASLHDVAVNEQPNQALSGLIRALLNLSVDLGAEDQETAALCGQVLGLIGCLDPSRIEVARKREHVLVLSNFDSADEVVRWVVFLLEHYLVHAFRSVTNAQAQGFVAYVIQELLKFCGFDQETTLRPRATQSHRVSQRWSELPDEVRATLTPFMNSKYTVTTSNSFNLAQRQYPGFSKDGNHGMWLRGLVYDLTRKASGENAKILFPHLARVVRGHDLAIAEFLLPYIVLNVVLTGTAQQSQDIRNELLAILEAQAETSEQLEHLKLCSESLFGVLDYLSIWVREKRRTLAETRANAFRTGTSPGDFDEIKDQGQIDTVTSFLGSVPTQLIAKRAMDCGSYARAIFNWEQFIRQNHPIIPPVTASDQSESIYYDLHDMYSRIDEPDGLEGISSHLSILSEEQQATLHARTGRWTAAQAWYESMLAGDEHDEALQEASLQCLRETGRFSTLLKYVDSYATASAPKTIPTFLLPFQVEGAWRLNDVDTLRRSVLNAQQSPLNDFGVKLGQLLLDSVDQNMEETEMGLQSLRTAVVSGMTTASTNSLQSSHKDLKNLHILAEVEMILNAHYEDGDLLKLADVLQNRLDLLGSQTGPKQELLAVHRLLLGLEKKTAASWLTSARLARRDGNVESAYYAVLRAAEGGAKAARLEEAKLLWHDGHRRQAISALQQAIKAGIFDEDVTGASDKPSTSILGTPQNLVAAKAHLLHAKWLNQAGQTQAKEMTARYQYATKTCQKWEKGHYHLGKHYWRLLEAERSLPKAKQDAILIHADLPRLVIENLVRSIPFGNKYWFESIPKILTLWLDLGMELSARSSRTDPILFEKQSNALHTVNKQLRKYFDRTPPYIFYSALPQMLSRISHPHPDVWKELSHIISRIVGTYPAQGLWSLMAVAKATDRVRQERGKDILGKLKSGEAKIRADGVSDVRGLVSAGQKLSDGLLLASEHAVESRVSHVNLFKDLSFNSRLAPCGLVVPMESTLSINIGQAADGVRIRLYKPFVHDKVTISSFLDDVLVLSSLQRPKKLTLRGSDGKLYGLLCKPRDDLRKDQRLMEFNGIINRALKRDPAGSKRRLYIKTYAVTPLSEESGCLEWVDGIKPIRDILLGLYSRKGVRPNYNDIRNDLNEASRAPDNVHIFEDKVLSKFPPALHEWFTEVFAEPESWFAARLRYARSAAVMSIVGHVLGLGDRHGENILLQESTGGVFHVDFNCLFDKGLTFDKPEVVPFRLTRNMVDAMGPYGYEGPFRKSCEVTLRLLRQNKDTLMTILETFLYDPTADFVGKKKRAVNGGVETPRDILEVVEGKLRGLFKGETMPLSEEGYVEALIAEAVNPYNLARMYIGWCAFL